MRPTYFAWLSHSAHLTTKVLYMCSAINSCVLLKVKLYAEGERYILNTILSSSVEINTSNTPNAFSSHILSDGTLCCALENRLKKGKQCRY